MASASMSDRTAASVGDRASTRFRLNRWSCRAWVSSWARVTRTMGVRSLPFTYTCPVRGMYTPITLSCTSWRSRADRSTGPDSRPMARMAAACCSKARRPALDVVGGPPTLRLKSLADRKSTGTGWRNVVARSCWTNVTMSATRGSHADGYEWLPCRRATHTDVSRRTTTRAAAPATTMGRSRNDSPEGARDTGSGAMGDRHLRGATAGWGSGANAGVRANAGAGACAGARSVAVGTAPLLRARAGNMTDCAGAAIRTSAVQRTP